MCTCVFFTWQINSAAAAAAAAIIIIIIIIMKLSDYIVNGFRMKFARWQHPAVRLDEVCCALHQLLDYDFAVCLSNKVHIKPQQLFLL